jgi:hypothetical protein
MRLRTGPNPSDWLDLGPASPNSHRRVYGTIPARTGSEMLPIVKHGMYLENRHRSKPQNPYSIHRENRT